MNEDRCLNLEDMSQNIFMGSSSLSCREGGSKRRDLLQSNPMEDMNFRHTDSSEVNRSLIFDNNNLFNTRNFKNNYSLNNKMNQTNQSELQIKIDDKQIIEQDDQINQHDQEQQLDKEDRQYYFIDQPQSQSSRKNRLNSHQSQSNLHQKSESKLNEQQQQQLQNTICLESINPNNDNKNGHGGSGGIVGNEHEHDNDMNEDNDSCAHHFNKMNDSIQQKQILSKSRTNRMMTIRNKQQLKHQISASDNNLQDEQENKCPKSSFTHAMDQNMTGGTINNFDKCRSSKQMFWFQRTKYIKKFTELIKSKSKLYLFRSMKEYYFEVLDDPSVSFKYYSKKGMLSQYESLLSLIIQVISMIIHLLFIFLIPINLAFQPPFLQNFSSLNKLPLFVIPLEIMIKLNTAIYKRGIIMKSREEIIKKFFKSRSKIDFLLFVIYLISLINENMTILQYMIAIKIFFVISTLRSIFQKYDQGMTHTILQKIIVLILVIIAFSHTQAMIYADIGFSQEDGWIKRVLKNDVDNHTTIYISSIYWSIITMATVGYGDIHPVTNIEMIYVSIVSLISCGVYGYALNSIGKILSDIQSRDEKFNRKMQMDSRNLDKSLQHTVHKYFEYLNKEDQVDDESAELMINDLPQSMKERILFDANHKVLYSQKIFNLNFSSSFLDRLSLEMKPLKLGPEIDLFDLQNKEDNGMRVYFILKGAVEVSISNKSMKKNNNILKKGDMLGIIEFLTQQRCEKIAKTANVVTLLYIEYKNFIECLSQFKNDYEQFCMIRDKISIYNNYFGLDQKCQVCFRYNHLQKDCPFLNYQPNYSKLIYQVNQSQNQSRSNEIERKKYKFSVLQSLQNVQAHSRKIQSYNMIQEYYDDEDDDDDSQDSQDDSQDERDQLNNNNGQRKTVLFENIIHEKKNTYQSNKQKKKKKILGTLLSQQKQFSYKSSIDNNNPQSLNDLSPNSRILNGGGYKIGQKIRSQTQKENNRQQKKLAKRYSIQNYSSNQQLLQQQLLINSILTGQNLFNLNNNNNNNNSNLQALFPPSLPSSNSQISLSLANNNNNNPMNTFNLFNQNNNNNIPFIPCAGIKSLTNLEQELESSSIHKSSQDAHQISEINLPVPTPATTSTSFHLQALPIQQQQQQQQHQQQQHQQEQLTLQQQQNLQQLNNINNQNSLSFFNRSMSREYLQQPYQKDYSFSTALNNIQQQLQGALQAQQQIVSKEQTLQQQQQQQQQNILTQQNIQSQSILNSQYQGMQKSQQINQINQMNASILNNNNANNANNSNNNNSNTNNLLISAAGCMSPKQQQEQDQSTIHYQQNGRYDSVYTPNNHSIHNYNNNYKYADSLNPLYYQQQLQLSDFITLDDFDTYKNYKLYFTHNNISNILKSFNLTLKSKNTTYKTNRIQRRFKKKKMS